jgi:phosphotransferase system enzyme I (PtsI)
MKTDRPGPPAGRERVFEGLGVGPGIVVGQAFLHDTSLVRAPQYRITASRVEAEQRRFALAVQAAGRQIDRLQVKARRLHGAAGEELGYLLDAYRQMLKGSRLTRGVHRRIAEERINAEAAVRKEISDMADAFAAMDDPYLASRGTDVREVGQRLVRYLTKTVYRPFEHLPLRAVIISQDLTPADTALLDPARVAGFATEMGGAESHTAIMARSLSLPAVLAVPGLIAAVRHGDDVIIDGSGGRVIVNPTHETLIEYRKRRADILRQRRALTRLRDLPAVTTDGAAVALMANIELPNEIAAVLDAGAQGIGLFRTEFLFMNRADWPGEDEQFAIFRDVVQRMAGRPVTIRVLDAGGDKLATATGGSMPDNPALGLRAIRFLLARPDVLETQLAAILRAAAHGPIRILVPMVTTAEEIAAVRMILDRVHRRLRRQKVPLPATLPPVGVMIEVPGAALAADSLAGGADFFSIGTNDLTQYTLAIDRADTTVAHLYNPLHPAVLRLIHFATGAALRGRIPVSLCGEMAGEPRLAGLLLGMGIRELSMTASSIPRVKQKVRRMALTDAEALTRLVMSEFDPLRIHALLAVPG